MKFFVEAQKGGSVGVLFAVGLEQFWELIWQWKWEGEDAEPIRVNGCRDPSPFSFNTIGSSTFFEIVQRRSLPNSGDSSLRVSELVLLIKFLSPSSDKNTFFDSIL